VNYVGVNQEDLAVNVGRARAMVQANHVVGRSSPSQEGVGPKNSIRMAVIRADGLPRPAK